MVSQELIDYIKAESAKGSSREQIEKVLLSAGWNIDDIDSAFSNPHEPQEAPIDQGSKVDVQAEQSIKKGFRLNKRLAALLLILILFGAGVYGYFFYYLTPERVIARMFKNMESIKSMDYKADLNLDFTGDFGSTSAFLPDQYSLSATLSGSQDLRDEETPRFSSNIDLTIKNLFSSRFEILTVGDILYVNLKNSPDFGFFDTSSFTNQWIKIDTQDFENLQPETFSKSTYDFTPEEKEELNDFIQGHSPLQITEKLEGEQIDGVDTFHYKYEINEGNLMKIVEKAAELSEHPLSDDEKFQMQDAFSKIEFYEGRIWIDKKSELLRKVALAINFKDDDPSNQELVLDTVFSFSNFNNASSIVVPIEAKDVNDVIEEYQKQLLEGESLPEGLDLKEFQIDPGGISIENLIPSVLGITFGN